jgi:hypothetical protein
MTLPGLNPEANMPGYDFARFSGKGATDFNFDALAAMDCTRDFAQAGIIYADGRSDTSYAPVNVTRTDKAASSRMWLSQSLPHKGQKPLWVSR